HRAARHQSRLGQSQRWTLRHRSGVDRRQAAARVGGLLAMMNFGLEARHVVIVGASSGIGYELARQFAAQRANVSIIAENDGIFAAAETLSRETERSVRGLRCDITSRDQLATLASELEPIDVLINNAGTGGLTSIDDMSDATVQAVRKIIDVNVLGLYWTTQ